ncbi:MAG: restriction endonuclease subunit S [Acidovorax sp.]|nr:restriction endonuclease subunit S [Acidovorax sp.]
MSSEWAVQRLDQIAEINPTRKVHKGSAVPFVDMAALPQFSRDISVNDVVVREAKGAGAHFQNGDTLLARITPCLENGKTAQVRCLDGDAIAEGSTEFIVLCGKDPADNDYIYYLCREPAFREYAIGRMEGTSGRQRVSWQSIAAYQFAFPSPEERRETARVLSTLDDRITLLRETNATLEAIAQALFKSWFVDFDPVRAKMEGRTPEGMDEATAALFPDGLETSELGEVPRGWRVGTVASVALLNAKSLSPRNPPPEINYLDLAGVKANVFDVPQCYSFADAPSRARRVLQEGDCIVGTVRPGNRSFGFIATAQNHLIGSTGFAVLSPKQHWMTAFTYLCATRDESIDRLASLADGGAYPAVRPDVVASTPCTLPPDEVMKVFDGAARPLLDAIGANSEQAQTLSTLRDTLLPRLISGQLRLPEAQAATEAALGGTLSV